MLKNYSNQIIERSMNDDRLKFPIGEFNKPDIITADIIHKWIGIIESFPTKLMEEVKSLSDEELKYKYRPNGWNIYQIVHHCADSHLNSFTRFKLALTEDSPTIRPYFEDKWAELEDCKNAPIEFSLKILDGLHARWTLLLKSLTNLQLDRTFLHPDGNNIISLKVNIGIYAWHCNHHLEHVRKAKLSNNKYL